MNKNLQLTKYLIADLLASATAWTAFYSYRKIYIEKATLVFGDKFLFGIIFIPLFWVLIYLILGTYKNIYRKSRLKELGQTLFISAAGVLVIFFAFLLDDEVASYKQYYHTFLSLYSLHFAFHHPRYIFHYKYFWL